MDDRFYTFIGGDVGPWQVVSHAAVAGPGLEVPPRLEVRNANVLVPPAGARWLLRGVTSHGRYTTRTEQDQLAAVQPPLGRPEATCAALIPITKSAAWWALTQDERRELFAAGAVHTTAARGYLPAIARRLHHGRDLGEPFDFLTWFEYAPADAAAFDDLLAALRVTAEWRYVEREVDLRLVRGPRVSSPNGPGGARAVVAAVA